MTPSRLANIGPVVALACCGIRSSGSVDVIRRYTPLFCGCSGTTAAFSSRLANASSVVGKILRSPHAHARIRGIDVTRAVALKGVKAVVTCADFPDHESVYAGPDRLERNMAHITRNIMAREKVLYEGHAVAAVAATGAAIADRALALIEVDYEVLPHVIDVREAMRPDAPLLHEDMVTRGDAPASERPSNVAKIREMAIGDVDEGFKRADRVVEMEFTTQPVHQAYIEPHACVARFGPDGKGEIWSSTQGQFMVRAMTAQIVGMNLSDLTVTPSELGGAFGGKTVVYVEPVALALARKSGLPVKMVMTRDEVFKASGPTSGSAMKVKIGATADGAITAAEGTFMYQAGAFPGSPVINACMCVLRILPLQIAGQGVQGAHGGAAGVVSRSPRHSAKKELPGFVRQIPGERLKDVAVLPDRSVNHFGAGTIRRCEPVRGAQ